MRWLELNFETTHEAAELLTDFLSSLGADGVQIHDAAEIKAVLADPDSLAYADSEFTDNLDPIVRIQAYFAEFPDGVRRNRDIDLYTPDLYDDVDKIHVPIIDLEKTIREKLGVFAQYLDVGTGYLGWKEIHEEDWAENWKQYYQTLHLTDRLVVNPSWIDYRPKPDEIVITLDPGSAFGTGTHETTALCAELMDELLLPDDCVLDLGTGSGILAIIAAKLGARPVEAVDIDRLAVQVAADNCQLNQVAVDVHQGELTAARSDTYDLIVANIIADVIAGLIGRIPEKLATDGLFIASGIIGEKKDLVLKAAAAAGLTLLVERERRDWYAFVFSAQGPGHDDCQTEIEEE
ncbi:MAG: 50S ribosomal protein L11 methyltransferase [Clostridiaceae bacterium]|nr:50S ribosomal protein L11 methyltransferase [Clostridiaceae bacterium]